ncbi:MAG: ABC transporter permease [Candidatus Saganbacteria bacterium]|nr:ABC transporter permease [Candidatus Saganbacteria bacterium]
MFDSRLFHFMKKEVLQLMRDKRMLFIAIVMPIVQLFLLGYVASMDIKHLSTAVLDDDKTYESREFLRRFNATEYFDFNYCLQNRGQISRYLDNGRAKLVIYIPHKFGQKIAHEQTADVQVDMDGSNASIAMITQSYVGAVGSMASADIFKERLFRHGLAKYASPLFDMRTRIWYNGDIESRYFYVPGIFAQLLMLISMILTVSSIVKEKTRGTIEMLSVTPLKPMELIMGKLIPFAGVAMFDMSIVFLISTLWFGVPMRGSVFLLFVTGAVYLLAGLGTGVLISTFAVNERQAGMLNLLVTAPQLLLSGFVFPIENMPLFIQFVTYFVPLRYFLSIVRELFLKGTGITYLWPEIWPLLLIGISILTVSVLKFRKSLV